MMTNTCVQNEDEMGKKEESKKDVISYRIGYVTKQNMTIYACCRLVPKDDILFKYVEVEYEDGTRKFFYEDEEGFEHFERNFVSKRFTSYHEFFTIDEIAIEKRGGLSLKYYVRRNADCYEKADIAQKEHELEILADSGKVKHLEDRITEYGHYDTEGKVR